MEGVNSPARATQLALAYLDLHSAGLLTEDVVQALAKRYQNMAFHSALLTPRDGETLLRAAGKMAGIEEPDERLFGDRPKLSDNDSEVLWNWAREVDNYMEEHWAISICWETRRRVTSNWPDEGSH